MATKMFLMQFVGFILFFTFFLIVFDIIINWNLFKKMGHEGWKSLIPIYNSFILHECLFGNGWYMLFALIPSLYSTRSLAVYSIISFVCLMYRIVYCIRLGKSFGKSTAFMVGLYFLPTIFKALLAFGNDTFEKLPEYDLRNPFD